jgi:hypothetical protein
MMAIVQQRYGRRRCSSSRTSASPRSPTYEVLVQGQAAGVAPDDWHVTLETAAPDRAFGRHSRKRDQRDVTTTAPRPVPTTPREGNDMTLTDRTTATGHAVRGEWGRSNRHWEEA